MDFCVKDGILEIPLSYGTRKPAEDSVWTEEDDELLASSMDDMETMEIEEY